MTKFDAKVITDKIRKADEHLYYRFEGLSIRFNQAMCEALNEYNAEEAKQGFPPVTASEVNWSLSDALCHFFELDNNFLGTDSEKLLDRFIEMLRCYHIGNIPESPDRFEEIKHLMDHDCAPDEKPMA